MMGISFVLAVGSLMGLFLLVCKKIATRGFLYPISAFRAFRHGILIALLMASLYIFHIYHVLSLLT